MPIQLKKIEINPELFIVNGGRGKNKTQKRREKKAKPKIPIKATTLRKTLLKKIKDYQQDEKETDEKKNTEEQKEAEQFQSDFDKSMQFLQDLSQKKEQKRHEKKERKAKKKKNRGNFSHNRTLKQEHSGPLVNVELAEELRESYVPNEIYSQKFPTPSEQPEVPYGCLKNGTKPTYRTWKRLTQKASYEKSPSSYISSVSGVNTAPASPASTASPATNIPKEPVISQPVSQSNAIPISQYTAASGPSISIPTDNKSAFAGQIHSPGLKSREKRLRELQSQIKTEQKKRRGRKKSKQSEIEELVGSSTNPKKITTRRYKLGKRGRHVSLLLKNKHTRKLVAHEYGLLKRKGILEIKNYLRKHGLLKAGSEAPNDILRKTYEQAVLGGDIHNMNGGVLLHNFFHDKDDEHK